MINPWVLIGMATICMMKCRMVGPAFRVEDCKVIILCMFY
jgi:hypothetical protein